MAEALIQPGANLQSDAIPAFQVARCIKLRQSLD